MVACAHGGDHSGVGHLHAVGESERLSNGVQWLLCKCVILPPFCSLSGQNPNDESPANVDAAKLLRESPAEFKKMVSRDVRRSQEEM
jgi:hypothetical protein